MKKILLCGSLLLATGAFSQVLVEGFEGLGGALPANWTSASSTPGTGDYVTGNAALANTGTYWPVPAHGDFAQINDDVCNCDLSATYLESPSMDLTGLSGVVLSYEFVDDITYGPSLPHQVELSVDGGATWTSIYTYTADNGNLNWQDNLVLLGATADGASNVKVRWFYNDGGTWATGLAIDNVVVKEPLLNDAKLLSASVERYALINTNNTLSIDVSNVGGNAITSVTIDWNDGTSHSQAITTNIAPGAMATLSHPIDVTYATAVEQNLAVTITQVNTVADADPSNNGGATMHNTLSQATSKAVVIEEGTGTWCGWCPRGAVAMDYMATNYTDFIGIAVHNGDPMTVTEYDNGAGISGFPGGNFERVILGGGVSQTSFETYYNDNINKGVPANVDVTVSGTGSSITLDASATFYTPVSAGNFRLAVVMVEDGVTGAGTQWNQANYYAGGGSGPMGGYESLTDPVPAADMVYDHVGVALLGGYDGQAGSVPATIVDGTVGTASFPYTIAATSTRDHMHAVALLLNNTTGAIMNAKSISIADGSSAGLAEEFVANLAIFPNPASDVVNVVFDGKGGAYSVAISNIAGVTVSSKSLENALGSQLVKLPVSELASGVYLVTVSSNGISTTQRVVVR